VLGNRKIDADSGLRQYEMASNLTDCLPSRFLKAFDASLPEMLASRAACLDRNEYFGELPIGVAGDRFLIFRPEPRGDRFLDVGEGLLLVFPLRHASGQGRAFDHKPAIFRLFEFYMEDHTDILPVKRPRVENDVGAPFNSNIHKRT